MEQNVNTVLAIKNNLMVIKGPQQVQLEAKIAEVSRSGIKKMGLSFVNNKDWTIGVFPTGDVSGKALTSQSAATLESTVGVASTFGAAFQVLLHSTHDDMLSILSLLKGQGLSRILATPTLVAMSGQEASFTVGGEFPVPTAGDNGGTNIEYKEYGTLLRFRPVVIGKETISLKLKAEVSSPDYSLGTASGGVAVPGLKTRIASSTLELKDGQSFVMAGLLKENSYSVVSKIPLLGDLPLVGALFTSKEWEKDETELVIIVTPRLVQPFNPGDVRALPGDTVRDSISDLDFFIRNQVEGPAGPRKAPLTQEVPQIIGEMGFE
jgi:pilus assembly protein CpaC